MRRLLGLLLPLLIAVFVAAVAETHPGFGLSGSRLVVSAAASAFVLGAIAVSVTIGRVLSSGSLSADEPSRPAGRAYPVACSAMLLGALVLLCAQPSGPGADGMFCGVLLFAWLLPSRTALPVLVTAFVILALFIGLSSQGIAGFAAFIALAAFCAAMFLADRLRRANVQAERLLVELERSRAAEARATVLAERQRLAREMHDVLAHSLSGLLLQLEGARMLAVEDPGDPRLPEAIDRAHHLGKSGLEEARQAIGMLRDDELPGPGRLADLAAQFQADRGIPCKLLLTGDQHELDPEAGLALYRVAEEALTNIIKHAHPEAVDIHLDYRPNSTQLTVEDHATTAHGAAPASPGGGYGLTGMRERAELLGGTLTAEATANGFRVELDVPS